MRNPLDALRVFVVAAESANFREAAARLAVSPQVVTRVVRELEQQLGEPLFHRSTRGVQLSTYGEQLVPRAREAVAGVEGLLQRHARRTRDEPAGVVRVAAPGVIGRRLVLDALAPLQRAYPALVVDLRLSDVIADVVNEQIDVGVRIGFLRDSRFVARPARPVHFHVVATPELVARTGRPRSVAELMQRPLTAFIDRSAGRPWPWMFKGERNVVPEAHAFVTDDPEAELNAVLAGLGYGQLTDYLADPHLRAGRLVNVLDGAAPPPWTLYVFRAQRTPVPARVRVVYDALVAALSS